MRYLNIILGVIGFICLAIAVGILIGKGWGWLTLGILIVLMGAAQDDRNTKG